jgi:hypothetical protein
LKQKFIVLISIKIFSYASITLFYDYVVTKKRANYRENSSEYVFWLESIKMNRGFLFWFLNDEEGLKHGRILDEKISYAKI